MELRLTPITLKEANVFIDKHHRHHNPVVGHKYSIAVSNNHEVVGVLIVGRPVSRHLDNGWTLEVTRCCTDGTKNVPSMLYGAAWRVAKGLGYTRLITYIIKGHEAGTSLKAAGWRLIGERGGGNWNCKARPRVETEHQQIKLMFQAQ